MDVGTALFFKPNPFLTHFHPKPCLNPTQAFLHLFKPFSSPSPSPLQLLPTECVVCWNRQRPTLDVFGASVRRWTPSAPASNDSVAAAPPPSAHLPSTPPPPCTYYLSPLTLHATHYLPKPSYYPSSPPQHHSRSLISSLPFAAGFPATSSSVAALWHAHTPSCHPCGFPSPRSSAIHLQFLPKPLPFAVEPKNPFTKTSPNSLLWQNT